MLLLFYHFHLQIRKLLLEVLIYFSCSLAHFCVLLKFFPCFFPRVQISSEYPYHFTFIQGIILCVSKVSCNLTFSFFPFYNVKDLHFASTP